MQRSLLSSVFISVLAFVLSAQQPTNAPRYEIAGVVVDHLTNAPINKSLVRLTPITGPGQLTSLTGEDGRFRFTNIPMGKYRLAAQRRGRLPHAFRETGQYSTAIVTGPDLDTRNIVFALKPPSSISGLIVEEDGEPLASVNILIFREVVDEGQKRVLQAANYQTSSTGQFHAGQLAAGTYYVAVQPIAWAGGNFGQSEFVYPLTYYGDTADAQSARAVTLSEGEQAHIEIAVHPVPNVHVPLPGFHSRGGGTVPQLLMRGPGGLLIPVNAVNTSSDDGTYELSGFPAGRYLARIFSQGRGGPRALSASGLQELDVADGAPLAIEEPNRGIAISGTVTFEGGGPLPDATLVFAAEDDQNRFGTRIQPDGSFTSGDEAIVPGSYAIQLDSNDHYVKAATAQGARMKGDRIELGESSRAKLAITVASSESLSKLDGFALRDGKPVAGVMVLLVPRDLNRGTLFRRDQTDSDGSFTLAGIRPGQYTLLVIDDDGRGLIYKDPAVIQPYLAAGQSLAVPRRATEPVQVTVQPRLR